MLYFGYGSLVNRDTRSASEPFYRASLSGWQRHWAHRAARPWLPPEPPRSASQVPQAAAIPNPGVCALTIAEAENSVIEGVVARLDDDKISALDQRESGYHRIKLPISCFCCESNLKESHVSVYVSAPEHNEWANHDYPILMSYIECVLAGYRQQFGAAGARRFMQTTAGWDKPIYDDRQAPLYPRSVRLTPQEQQLADKLLPEFTDRQ